MKNLLEVNVAGIPAKVLATDIETLSIIQKFNGMVASYKRLLSDNGSLTLFENAVKVAIKTGTVDALYDGDVKRDLPLGKPNRRCGRLSLAHFLEAAINVLYFAGDANIFYLEKGLFLEMVATALTHDAIEDSIIKDAERNIVGFSYTFEDLNNDLSVGVEDSTIVKKIVKNVTALTIPWEYQASNKITQETLFSQLTVNGEFNTVAWYVRLCETITALGELELLGFSNGGVMNIADKEKFYLPKLRKMSNNLDDLMFTPENIKTTSNRIKYIFETVIKNSRRRNAYFVPNK